MTLPVPFDDAVTIAEFLVVLGRAVEPSRYVTALAEERTSQVNQATINATWGML